MENCNANWWSGEDLFSCKCVLLAWLFIDSAVWGLKMMILSQLYEKRTMFTQIVYQFQNYIRLISSLNGHFISIKFLLNANCHFYYFRIKLFYYFGFVFKSKPFFFCNLIYSLKCCWIDERVLINFWCHNWCRFSQLKIHLSLNLINTLFL